MHMGPSFSEGVRAGADRHYVCAVEMSLLSGHKTLASGQLLGYRDVLLQGQVHHLNRVLRVTAQPAAFRGHGNR
jgi:hypothetical protein